MNLARRGSPGRRMVSAISAPLGAMWGVLVTVFLFSGAVAFLSPLVYLAGLVPERGVFLLPVGAWAGTENPALSACLDG